MTADAGHGEVTTRARHDDAAGILGRLSGRSVRCYHCGEWFRAAVRAETASCTCCYRQVSVADVQVKESFWGTSLMSAGRITVQRRGIVRAKLIVACHGVTVLGRVEAQVLCGGPVVLGPQAVFKGALTAPSLSVEAGAVIEAAEINVPAQPIGAVEIPRAGAGRVLDASPSFMPGPA